MLQRITAKIQCERSTRRTKWKARRNQTKRKLLSQRCTQGIQNIVYICIHLLCVYKLCVIICVHMVNLFCCTRYIYQMVSFGKFEKYSTVSQDRLEQSRVEYGMVMYGWILGMDRYGMLYHSILLYNMYWYVQCSLGIVKYSIYSQHGTPWFIEAAQPGLQIKVPGSARWRSAGRNAAGERDVFVDWDYACKLTNT